MILSVTLIIMVLWLAYGNGANDNFKGVATLYGSGAATYRKALGWATLSTFAGSLLSIVLAKGLVAVFSGKGLLPDTLLGDPLTLTAISAAAAITIMLATLLGMPTSTTHALAGALLGIAWATSPLEVPWGGFLTLFAVPLLLSPFLAIAITVLAYPLLRRVRIWSGVTRASCVCVEETPLQQESTRGGEMVSSAAIPQLRIGEHSTCANYAGSIAGVDAQSAVDWLHYVSAGAVCFSRAVNDTPKIAALLLALNGLGSYTALALVAIAMALGGLIQSRRVAETMSHRITALNPGQGLCANLVTAGLVLAASRIGVPVSTTHVSCGTILGIGMVERNARWKTVAAIVLAWVTTLPLAAVLGAVVYKVIT